MTDRKAMDTRQRLLLRELTHRVKYTDGRTSDHPPSATLQHILQRFIGRLDGRIAALAAAHSLLVDSEWKGADLATLAHKQVEPYLGGKTGTS